MAGYPGSYKPSQSPSTGAAQGKSFTRKMSEKFTRTSVTGTAVSAINARQAELQAASKN